MSLAWVPRFSYGVESIYDDPIDLDLSFPFAPPVPIDNTIGGREIAAAGLPAAYKVRQDDILALDLRFSEDEIANVRDFIRWAQESQATFTFYPDVRDLGHFYTCYLDVPSMGEKIRYERDPYFSFYILPIELRSIIGPFAIKYFLDVFEE